MEKIIGGVKRKRSELIQSKKGICIDLILINTTSKKDKISNSFSSSESIKEEKEKGFGFKKDE